MSIAKILVIISCIVALSVVVVEAVLPDPAIETGNALLDFAKEQTVDNPQAKRVINMAEVSWGIVGVAGFVIFISSAISIVLKSSGGSGSGR
ncbi:MAG: hypothetical protein FWG55_04840 [Candidatus Bathyarchaeota archaeon]|nr:hypothetical protein [Candidatus Termiticorpusculum sp.]